MTRGRRAPARRLFRSAFQPGLRPTQRRKMKRGRRARARRPLSLLDDLDRGQSSVDQPRERDQEASETPRRGRSCSHSTATSTASPGTGSFAGAGRIERDLTWKRLLMVTTTPRAPRDCNGGANEKCRDFRDERGDKREAVDRFRSSAPVHGIAASWCSWGRPPTRCGANMRVKPEANGMLMPTERSERRACT